jgi:putative hydrolase of the HAD superfamily
VSKIRAVFFDVGGTLLRVHPSVGAIYARAARKFGFNFDDDTMDQAFRAAWREAQLRSQSLTMADKQWWRQLVFDTLARCGVAKNRDKIEACFAELYEIFASPDAWRVYDDAIFALKLARERGLHVGAISNWDWRLRPLLEKLGVSGQLDSLTVSCEVGAEKPDAKIFQHALAQAGAAAGEALHVGDGLEDDVRGAMAGGMRAVWLNRAGERARTDAPMVKSLRELEKFLR